MSLLSSLSRAGRLGLTLLGLYLGGTAAAGATVGCVGKIWNPLTDLDYTLMGGIKVAGLTMMKAPSSLGEPPEHAEDAVCSCMNGAQSGFGLGLTFWAPSYINDLARQGGCLGFMATNILPGFAMATSSGQNSTVHKAKSDSVTNMQVHWAYADITALAGKSLFEKCNVAGGMKISYMTEMDFVWQNDMYATLMSPQVALLAAAPLLSQMVCGAESIVNTLGGWQDSGICAWKGTRFPYSASSIAKDSAQVTNMDVTIKYLARQALLGTTMSTMGPSAQCKPQYSPQYKPLQHRYQWSFPSKTSTRFNVDMIRWGIFKNNGAPSGASMISLTNEAAAVANVNPNITVGSQAPTGTGSATVPTATDLSAAKSILSKIPLPLNYPTREAGFMQVWEARQCCMMVLTLDNIVQTIVKNVLTTDGGQLAKLYDYYKKATLAYQIVTDPVGAALGYVGQTISNAILSPLQGAMSGLLGSASSGSPGLDWNSIGSASGGGSGGVMDWNSIGK